MLEPVWRNHKDTAAFRNDNTSVFSILCKYPVRQILGYILEDTEPVWGCYRIKYSQPTVEMTYHGRSQFL